MEDDATIQHERAVKFDFHTGRDHKSTARSARGHRRGVVVGADEIRAAGRLGRPQVREGTPFPASSTTTSGDASSNKVASAPVKLRGAEGHRAPALTSALATDAIPGIAERRLREVAELPTHPMVLVEAAEAGRAAELAHREVQDRCADVRLFWQLSSDRRPHLLGVAQDHEPPALGIESFDGERGHRREHLRRLVDEQDVELPKHRLGREHLARAVRRRADDDAALGAEDLGVDVFTIEDVERVAVPEAVARDASMELAVAVEPHVQRLAVCGGGDDHPRLALRGDVALRRRAVFLTERDPARLPRRRGPLGVGVALEHPDRVVGAAQRAELLEEAVERRVRAGRDEDF